jgi:hypothetical protein
VATHEDVLKYGDYIREGDVIFDAPTKTFSDGINQLRYTSISKTFPNMRDSATLWIDGSKIGPLCEIGFLNDNETKPWSISSATLRPIPGTKVDAIYTHNSYGGFLFLVQGLKNFRVDGESDAYPGLSVWPEDRVYLRGTFGFSVTSIGIYEGFHGFSISVLDGGTFEIKGVEGEHGFSLLRFQGGNYDWTIESVKIYRCFIHDTESEGTYIGATHGPPLAKLKNLQFYDCILSRCGSEAIQLQHLIGNCFIHNITAFAGDAGYLSQFQPSQDTGSQWSIDEGTTTVSNIFFDTWGSHAANFFGSNAYPNNGNSKVIFKKVAFNNGRGEPIYFHNSMKYGMKWYFDSLYIRKTNGDYYIDSKTSPTNWQISANNGSDSVTFFDVFHDGSRPNVFQNVSRLQVLKQPTLMAEIPDVEYVNSGFKEPAHKIKFWREYLAAYISGNDTTKVSVELDDIMIDRENDHKPVFCKAIVKHKATATRPKNDKAHYVTLTWDSLGVRSDDPAWKSCDPQYPYPPDDLRIPSDNFYGKLGIGYIQKKPNCDDYRAEIEKLKIIIAEKERTILNLTRLVHGIPFWFWILFFLNAAIIIILILTRRKSGFHQV